MDIDLLFKLCNFAVLPQWFLMIFLPSHKLTQWLIRVPIIPFALVFVYVAYVINCFGVEGGGMGSLDELKVLFGIKEAILAGWVHYLIFDLLVGTWVLTDSRKKGINHLLVAPCLFFCLMMGPVGWACYMGLRYFTSGTNNPKLQSPS